MSNQKHNRQTKDMDIVIGNNIRFLRKQNNMTQPDVGAKLGVTFQQVQKYEKATNRISASRLHEISEIFNVDINTFFQTTQQSQGQING